MSKMKFAMAMLAVGGGVGAAVQVQAATVVTDTLDMPMYQTLTPITLVGSSPQFDFGKSDTISNVFETDNYANGTPVNSALGIKSSTPGLPNAGETFNQQSYVTGLFGTDEGPDGNVDTASYIHLIFTADGDLYAGDAYIDASGELETITYEQVPSNFVPEPEAWALLVAGAALTGGALRTARRRQAAIA